jgi:5-methylcytosine-specific restriction endonuclease McrA
MNYIGTKTHGCRHLAEYDIDEILSQIHPFDDLTKTVFFVQDGEKLRRLKVRMNSIRYHLMAKSRICEACGLVGTRMMLDVHTCMYSRCHFNLYAEVDGELILMTRDHIVPRCQGGEDTLENLQTLCTRCNGIKGGRIMTIAELRELIAERELVTA